MVPKQNGTCKSSTQKPNLIFSVKPVDKMRLRHLDKLPNLRRIAGVRTMIREHVVLSTSFHQCGQDPAITTYYKFCFRTLQICQRRDCT